MADYSIADGQKTLEELCHEAEKELDNHRLMDLIEEIERRLDEEHKKRRASKSV